jgi:hypothetical protein
MNQIKTTISGSVPVEPFNQPFQGFKTSFAYQPAPQMSNVVNNLPLQQLQQPMSNPSPQILPQISQYVSSFP